MAQQVDKRFIDFGTTGNKVNSQAVPANFTPSNYTPAQVDSEGTDKVSAHLKGIDTALGSGGGTIAKYTAVQAASGSWGAYGTGYRQELTMPGSLNYKSGIIQIYDNSTGEKIDAETSDGSSATKFYIYTNDNSLTYDCVIIG